jgi:hypothetical protein
MHPKRSILWAALYAAIASVATVIGIAIIATGLAIGGQEVYDTYQATDTVTTAVLVDAAPGLLVVLVGIVVWRLGTGVALFVTIPGALKEELTQTYDNEQVKSEILTVLDDRLSEMEREVQGLRQDEYEEDEEYGGGFELGD